AADMRQGDSSIPIAAGAIDRTTAEDWAQVQSILRDLETNRTQLAALPSFADRPPSPKLVLTHASLQGKRAELLIGLFRTSNKLRAQYDEKLKQCELHPKSASASHLSDADLALIETRLLVLKPFMPAGYWFDP